MDFLDVEIHPNFILKFWILLKQLRVLIKLFHQLFVSPFESLSWVKVPHLLGHCHLPALVSSGNLVDFIHEVIIVPCWLFD